MVRDDGLTSLSSRLANVALPDVDGAPLRLGSLWADAPAVVIFLRHYGCIFCREHIAQLREHESEFTKKGARIAAISLGDRNYGRIFREDTGITFPLLVDEERIAYREAGLGSAGPLHIFRSDNMSARKRAKQSGHRQHMRHFGRNPFQLGGSFVFSPDQRDLFTHVSQTFGDNAPISALLAAIT